MKGAVPEMTKRKPGVLPPEFIANVERLRECQTAAAKRASKETSKKQCLKEPKQQSSVGNKKARLPFKPTVAVRNIAGIDGTGRIKQGTVACSTCARDMEAKESKAVPAAAHAAAATNGNVSCAEVQGEQGVGALAAANTEGAASRAVAIVKKIKSIPTANFYGGGKARSLCDVMCDARGQKLALRLRAAVLRYRRTNVFREFRQQKEAFSFADSLMARTEDARVFARELDKKGTRRFFVTTYEECWRRLMRTNHNCRHFYEVVREGSPCYLYFDIEYSKTLNPSTDGQHAMRAFLDFLPRGLRKLYPAHDILIRPGDVIDLDSSTDVKFSRHVIVRPNAAQIAFYDNIQMGACVRRLVDLLDAEVKQGAAHALRHIYVRTAGGACFIFNHASAKIARFHTDGESTCRSKGFCRAGRVAPGGGDTA